LAIHEPALALQCQRVLALPSKRFMRGPVEFLTDKETAALVAAPYPRKWIGRRDKAVLLVEVQTGLRNNEITSLRRRDVEFGVGASCPLLREGPGDAAHATGAPRVAGRKPVRQWPSPVRSWSSNSRRGEALLVGICALKFVVYTMATTRSRKVLVRWLGSIFRGVLCSDHLVVYWKYHAGLAQFCGAHLKRNLPANPRVE
jgi:hypothetical protein